MTRHEQAIQELQVHICSNRPLIYVCTSEEHRVLESLKGLATNPKFDWTIVEWDVAKGLTTNDNTFDIPGGPRDQLDVLAWFQGVPAPHKKYTVLVLKDFHQFLGSAGNMGQIEFQVGRMLFNLAEKGQFSHKPIVIVGTKLFLTPELEKFCAVIDWPLPEPLDIASYVQGLLEEAGKKPELKKKFKTSYTETEMSDLARSYQGLTLREITYLTTYSMLTETSLEPDRVAAAKRDIIRKSGLLDWRDVNINLDDVGGLGGLKQWLFKRQKAFTDEAHKYGLPSNPKGLLLVGVQGGGKSYSAEAIASFWKLPLIRLDLGKIFQGIVGSSEENIRHVIKVAESVSPAVLMIDELEKGFSGVNSSGQSDAGTTSRVFASFLTWMQEKQSAVYVVATANDVSQLPPELLRKGRFDEIFFVDLPNEVERREILKIHLEKVRKEDISMYDIDLIAANSDMFTGAELEAVIISAMYDAFSEGREFTTEDIQAAIAETIPLAVTMGEKIEDLREWAKTRARHASKMHDKRSDGNARAIAPAEVEEDIDL